MARRYRRRSKLVWVRELDRQAIHALAGRLAHKRPREGLSRQEEWLWDQLMVELRWRFGQPGPWFLKCRCLFCSESASDPLS